MYKHAHDFASEFYSNGESIITNNIDGITFVLNASATQIFKICSDKSSDDVIREYIQLVDPDDVVAIGPDEIAKDIQNLLYQMVTNGILMEL